MTTISKQNLALLHATAKTRESIFALTHLKLTPERIYASNGHSLYSSPINNQHDDFPDCSIAGAVEHDGCMLLEAEILKSVAIPNNRFTPIVNNIDILIDDTHKHIVTNDLKAVRDIKITHEDHEWPNNEMIEQLANTLVDTQKVRLSLAELEVLVKVLKQHGDETAILTVAGPTNMVQIDTNSGLKGYIMPYTLEA